MSEGKIELRGVCVHNLKQVDLDIPYRQLVAFCGVSGSGKTSMALDTLYAEGQRRYLESLSLYSRQFLDQFEKPQAERMDGLPAAIAISHEEVTRLSRATIGTATEIVDYLRLLYAKIGRLVCPTCASPVERSSPELAAETLGALEAGTRFMIAFTVGKGESTTIPVLREAGFVRAIVDGKTTELASLAADAEPAGGEMLVVVDRLAAGQSGGQRVADSLETAFRWGNGRAMALVEVAAEASAVVCDGRLWRRMGFSTRLECAGCGRVFAEQDPRHLSFSSPLGACPACEGSGNIVEWDLGLIVPDSQKSLREGAIAPWNTPAYRHELEELLALAGDYGIPTDVPFASLTAAQVERIREGVPERSFGGLRGFFAWLEKRQYKLHIRVFMNRWRKSRECPTCHGTRLNEEALAWQLGGHNIAQLCSLRIEQAMALLRGLALSEHEAVISRAVLPQVLARLGFLVEVGVGHLTLARGMRTLSSGEAQRVSLTAVLGSSLVNMLYVLDEPSRALHPRDVGRLAGCIRRLQARGNTVVMVEHEPDLLRTADRLIEFGPGAGDRGGTITFAGTLDEMLQPGASLSGEFLAGRRGISLPKSRRPPQRGRLKLLGARGHNLKQVSVEFPLNVLVVVAGVSGAGKSSLVQETLYGALCRRKHKECEEPLPYDDIVGDGQIDDVVLVDQTSIGRSARSNPVTYVKAFDPIRQVFAETVEARMHNYTASHFSFNVEGGRCDACEGEGQRRVDMQFMPDVFIKCSECGGTRYRREILAVKYRNKSIAEVLAMTAREAFGFFRGQTKVQAKLKQLMDVGLDYLLLGQAANTLSAGEAQRLKLAAHLSEASRSRTLFLLDEPTAGLHFADILTLLDCFEALLAVGHSLIVIEHNLQLLRAADYIIDLGPEAGDEGGTVVVAGTPEEVAACPESHTGRYLVEALKMGSS